MQETWVLSLDWEDPLQEGMATHSSIHAWRIPWTEKPGGLQSMWLQRVRHDWATSTQFPRAIDPYHLWTKLQIKKYFSRWEWFHSCLHLKTFLLSPHSLTQSVGFLYIQICHAFFPLPPWLQICCPSSLISPSSYLSFFSPNSSLTASPFSAFHDEWGTISNPPVQLVCSTWHWLNYSVVWDYLPNLYISHLSISFKWPGTMLIANFVILALNAVLRRYEILRGWLTHWIAIRRCILKSS